MMKEHEFSTEYKEKRDALLRGIALAETGHVRRAFAAPVKIIAAAVLACVMLAGTVVAAVELGVFEILRGDDKTVVNIGEVTTRDKNEDPLEESITVLSSAEKKGELPRVMLIREYMPEDLMDAKNGTEIKLGDFDSGATLSFDMVYLGGDGFTYELGAESAIEKFEVNGHSAMIIDRSQTLYYNKILSLYFEDCDILVNCFAGYGVPREELVKIASGLRVEPAGAEGEVYPIVHNYGRITVAESLAVTGGYRPLQITKKLELGETVTFREDHFSSLTNDVEFFEADIELTPIEVNLADSIRGLDSDRFLHDNVKAFVSDSGELISYPRTEILKGITPSDEDRFGETVNVKKKLVLLTFKLKNTSKTDGATYIPASLKLHVGSDESRLLDYVYDSTPQKYSTVEYPVYYDGGCGGRSYYRTELNAEEEKQCTIGYLVDEDMLDEAYVLISKNGSAEYHLKMAE